MTIEEAFPLNLKRLIRERGYKSIKEFCLKKNVDYSTIWAYCNGKRLPNLYSLWEMAKVLQCSLNEFAKGATE